MELLLRCLSGSKLDMLDIGCWIGWISWIGWIGLDKLDRAG